MSKNILKRKAEKDIPKETKKMEVQEQEENEFDLPEPLQTESEEAFFDMNFIETQHRDQYKMTLRPMELEKMTSLQFLYQRETALAYLYCHENGYLKISKPNLFANKINKENKEVVSAINWCCKNPKMSFEDFAKDNQMSQDQVKVSCSTHNFNIYLSYIRAISSTFTRNTPIPALPMNINFDFLEDYVKEEGLAALRQLKEYPVPKQHKMNTHKHTYVNPMFMMAFHTGCAKQTKTGIKEHSMYGTLSFCSATSAQLKDKPSIRCDGFGDSNIKAERGCYFAHLRPTKNAYNQTDNYLSAVVQGYFDYYLNTPDYVGKKESKVSNEVVAKIDLPDF